MTAHGSLDGPYLDLIRDGLPGIADAHGRDWDVPIWNALVRTAMSAHQRGHDFAQWHALVTESTSRLGHQAQRMGGRKDRSRAEMNKHLLAVWAKAEQVATERPAPSKDDIAGRITLVRRHVADADYPLPDNQRAVLDAACALAEKYGTLRPVMPLRAVSEHTGLSIKAVRTALAKLDDAGLLNLARRGVGGPETKSERWRASLYRLPSAEALAARGGTYTPKYKTYVPLHKTYVPLEETTVPESASALVELAEANAQIEELKRQLADDLTEKVTARVIAEMGLPQPTAARVRHLRPVKP